MLLIRPPMSVVQWFISSEFEAQGLSPDNVRLKIVHSIKKRRYSTWAISAIEQHHEKQESTHRRGKFKLRQRIA